MNVTSAPKTPVGLLRVLAAQLYDLLLVFGLWICATAVAVGALVLLTGGESFSTTNPLAGSPWFRLYLLLVTMAFFVGFWSTGGQTLGMRAWQIRLCRRTGGAVSPPRALLRFATAGLSWLALGLGYLWMLLDREGLSWHDRLSGTCLEYHRRR